MSYLPQEKINWFGESSPIFPYLVSSLCSSKACENKGIKVGAEIIVLKKY